MLGDRRLTADNIREGCSYLVRPEEMGVPAEHFDPSLLPLAVHELAVRTFGEGHERRPLGCRENPAENRGRGAVFALNRSAMRSCSVPASGSPRMR